MKRVMLGNTGINISTLCFGSLTMGPLQAGLTLEDGAGVLAHAFEQGVNFADTAQLYKTYKYIRRAMEITGACDIVISSKTYAHTRELAIEAVEEARRELNRDYIDIFMLHEQESKHTLRGHSEALEYLLECRQKGIIRAVGISMHHVAAVNGAVELGLDCIHPLINRMGLGLVDGGIADMERAASKAYDCGLGVFAMKPLGGGNLLRSAKQSLEYVRSLPFIHSIAVGMQSIQEVDANIRFWETGSFTSEQEEALGKIKRSLHIDDWCEGCGACVKRCSAKALRLEEDKAVCDGAKCLLCGYCSADCPVFAIKMI